MTARSSEAADAWSFRLHFRLQPGHQPGGAHPEAQERRRDEQHRRRAQRACEHAREPRPDDRADGPPHGNRAEQPPALFEREAVGHERPEDHGAEQIEDAVPDVEDAAAHVTHGVGCHRDEQVEADQAGREEEIGDGDEHHPPEAAHQPSEHRIDCQRDDRSADEEPPNRVESAAHADGIARRTHHADRGEDAEKVERRHHKRRDLALPHVQKPLHKSRHAHATIQRYDDASDRSPTPSPSSRHRRGGGDAGGGPDAYRHTGRWSSSPPLPRPSRWAR